MMAAIQERRQPPGSPSLDSFEETYKTAYSHGLEAIYSLETVDLRTVRKIKDPAETESLLFVAPDDSENEDEERQLAFDFGDSFREWLEPIFLDEPIQVLHLSFQTQSCLLELGIKRIRDILEQGLGESVFLKGMGQGHIDEARKKLKAYIGKKSMTKAATVSLKSLLLGILIGGNFKKLSAYMSGYELADFMPLSQTEKVGAKTLLASPDQTWKDEVKAFLSETTRQEALLLSLKKVSAAFILPWIRRRGGVATETEIMERLERVTDESDKVQAFCHFLQSHMTGFRFPFELTLFQPEDGIHCCDEAISKAYREIVFTARSYFYHSSVSYTMEELILLIQKEFIKEWKGYSSQLIWDCIVRSSAFQLQKDLSGRILLTLS